MAQALDPGTYGGFDEAEARRRAMRERAGRSDPFGGPQITEGNFGDFASPSSQPTVAQQSGPRDAHDRMSVVERNEQSQMGPFQGSQVSANQRENRAGTQFAISADDRAMMDRIVADSQRQEALRQRRQSETTAPSKQLAQQDYYADDRAIQARTPLQQAVQAADQPSAAEAQQRGIDIMGNTAGAFVPVGRLLGPAARFIGETPLGTALRNRIAQLGGRAPSALQNAAAAGERAAFGPQGAEQAGRGFRLVGRPKPSLYGAADDFLGVADDASVIAARARSANAAARQAAGTMDEASLAAARARQPTPLAQAIAGRLRSTPLIRAVTPTTAGLGGLAGVIAGSGTQPPEAKPLENNPQQGSPQGQQPQIASPQAATPPGAQAPQPTPPPPGPEAPPPPGGPIQKPIPGRPLRDETQPPIPVDVVEPGGPKKIPGLPGPLVVPPPGPPKAAVTPIVEPVRPRAGGPPTGVTPGQTPAGPTLGPVPQGPLNSEAMRTQVIADLNGIAQQINAGPQAPDVMALFLSQGSKLLDLIAEQEKQLRAQAAQDGSTIDPATQNTLDTLRESLGRELKATKERLNARGLLDSGILVEAEQMLTKGNLSDQAKILAERLSRIQNNLNQGLAQFRSQRIDTASRFGMAGAQAQTQAEQAERQRLDQARQTLIQGRLSVAGQYGQEEQAQANRDFQSLQAEIARNYADAQAQRSREAAAAEAEANRQNALRIAEMNNVARSQPTRSQQRTTEADQRKAKVDADTQQVISEIINTPGIDVNAAIRDSYGQPGFENVDWNRVIAEVGKIGTAPKPDSGLQWPWQP